MKTFLLICGFQFFNIFAGAQSNQWAWMKGDNIPVVIDNATPVYGVLGVASATNRPGQRDDAVTWRGNAGNLWLFGGWGNAVNGFGPLNDLWKYNIATGLWTWMKGDNTTNSMGVYGTVNVASATNKPGARSGAVGWTDASGVLWLFSGNGNGNAAGGLLNDVWKYSPATGQWTWVKGDQTVNNAGVYGTLGTAAAGNKPGGRYIAAGGWVDASGNFWMFGGWGKGAAGSHGRLNDLWRYNPGTNQWTWVKGDQTVNLAGVYGTLNVAAAGNKPGGRYQMTTWMDPAGKLWLFGGSGYGSSTLNNDDLNDLWSYTISTGQWTWVKGDNTSFANDGIYGSQGVAAAANKPGSRSGAVSWRDASGNLWLFGGYGRGDGTSGTGELCDLWKFNPVTLQWAWMKGYKSAFVNGNYGAQNEFNTIYTPGGRTKSGAWADASGNFWVYGGSGPLRYNFMSTSLNELWQFSPTLNQWAWMGGDNYSESYIKGIYGTQGVPAVLNNPGGRTAAASVISNNGNLYLFGGNGGSATGYGHLNDMWKFDTTTKNWVWLKGDSIANVPGVYGTIGIANPANKPGARSGSVTWKDKDGNIWLFGGSGINGLHNDLWKYTVALNQWTWMHGSDTANGLGVYGTKGVSTPLNNPGSRTSTVGWTDSTGNLWLFGGEGYAESEYQGQLGDLWKYNPISNEWVWINGYPFTGSAGSYGTPGISSPDNLPACRYAATGWSGTGNSLWLFGGYTDNNFSNGNLNDVWKFDIGLNEWVLLKGDQNTDQFAVYGTQGIPGYQNHPGSRNGAVGWSDTLGNFWLSGGSGKTDFTEGLLNDIWVYKPAFNQWTWVNAENTADAFSNYGSAGVFDPTFTPGGRSGGNGWFGSNTGLWFFGGSGNDLWLYKPPCQGQILLNPVQGTVCFNGTSFTLTASGSTMYQWFKDGVLISGAISSSYVATSPGTYIVKGNTNICNDVFSNEVLISAPTVTPSLGGTGIYCLGDPVNVGIPVTVEDQDYTWLRNNSAVYGPIGGNGGNQSLQFNMDFGRTGTYIVESRKPGCTNVFSNNVYVALAEITGLTAYAVCSNDISFNWNRVAPSFMTQKYEYAVTLSPSPPANGTPTTSSQITVSSLNPGTNYYIHVRSGCGFDLTNFGNWNTLQVTTELTPLPAGTAEWTGKYDENWTDSRNWKCGIVPNASSMVIINGGKPIYPYLTNNVTVKALNLNPGAYMEVAPGFKLTVTSQ